MSAMLESVANLLDFEEEVGGNCMVTFDRNKVSFSVRSQILASINGSEIVNVGIDFCFR